MNQLVQLKRHGIQAQQGKLIGLFVGIMVQLKLQQQRQQQQPQRPRRPTQRRSSMMRMMHYFLRKKGEGGSSRKGHYHSDRPRSSISRSNRPRRSRRRTQRRCGLQPSWTLWCLPKLDDVPSWMGWTVKTGTLREAGKEQRKGSRRGLDCSR